jgi:hypothetical protein
MGRREYSDAEIQRMQREAEDRVREMQERTRQAAARENGAAPQPQTGNRNWSHWNGARRVSYRSPNQQQEQHRAHQQEQHRAQQQEQQRAQPHQQEQTHQHRPQQHQHQHPQHRTTQQSPGPRPTVIEEILRALELDEDYLLILGLLMILINQRADTTIILALAYLLI